MAARCDEAKKSAVEQSFHCIAMEHTPGCPGKSMAQQTGNLEALGVAAGGSAQMEWISVAVLVEVRYDARPAQKARGSSGRLAMA